MKIESVEKETGWLIEKNFGKFEAKDKHFRTVFISEKLSDLRYVLLAWNQKQELDNGGK